ncbi:AraC family transcriptional regulator [Geodermatophilus sp. DSM 44513]|uniref:AraC family transcriptional regulator n=1 Tax=Geodermatophilus sp. DSM 44513 TaxID=1528104 RepID=UPI0012762FA4|nr:AraC family transcriptional regulator [Geodermatophilus sp. DSM 44513]WNV74284.1 AraC family transcriptional regulator [Geodermatophilus sp. DSM 44513]
MSRTLGGALPSGLGRSCGPGGDSIRFGPGARGFERAEVHLSSLTFRPHRHDTYAIGVTTAGVQTFGYRGSRRICLPGEVHVLHPDEEHDGAAGTDDGFGYRILYVAPEALRGALGGRPLPFVADPVVRDSRATRPLAALVSDVDEPVSGLHAAELAVVVADVLTRLGPGPRRPRPAIDERAVESVREYLTAHAAEQTSASTLEAMTGLDRWSLARQFRLAFGTSPDRYRTLRRLGLARAALEAGHPVAHAAVEAGFADQSHLTRQFTRAYGVTPSRWQALRASPLRRVSSGRDQAGTADRRRSPPRCPGPCGGSRPTPQADRSPGPGAGAFFGRSPR